MLSIMAAMHDLDDDSIKALFGEAIIDELKAIREYLGMVPLAGQRLLTLEDHVANMDDTLKVVSALGRAHEKDIGKIKQNIRTVKEASIRLGNELTA